VFWSLRFLISHCSHKETITIAIAKAEGVYHEFGTIENEPKAINGEKAWSPQSHCSFVMKLEFAVTPFIVNDRIENGTRVPIGQMISPR